MTWPEADENRISGNGSTEVLDNQAPERKIPEIFRKFPVLEFEAVLITSSGLGCTILLQTNNPPLTTPRRF